MLPVAFHADPPQAMLMLALCPDAMEMFFSLGYTLDVASFTFWLVPREECGQTMEAFTSSVSHAFALLSVKDTIEIAVSSFYSCQAGSHTES